MPDVLDASVHDDHILAISQVDNHPRVDGQVAGFHRAPFGVEQPDVVEDYTPDGRRVGCQVRGHRAQPVAPLRRQPRRHRAP